MNDNKQAVMEIYAAFGKGDVDGILRQMASDVQWEYAWAQSPVPWLAPGTGPGHVARFVGALTQGCAIEKLEVKRVLAEGDLVVALVDVDGVVRSTGKRIVETDEPHIWYFDDRGRVRKFRHAADTYQQARALQPA